MKIKLDENLPRRLQDALQHLGHDTDTVNEEGLTGASDDTVWREAQEAGRFLITQDLDFSDIKRFAPGTHAGILLVRLREPGRDALHERVLTAVQQADFDGWAGCFVVVTEHKIRVRRAGGG